MRDRPVDDAVRAHRRQRCNGRGRRTCAFWRCACRPAHRQRVGQGARGGRPHEHDQKVRRRSTAPGRSAALTRCPQPLRRQSDGGPRGAVPDAAQGGQPAGRRRVSGAARRRHHRPAALHDPRRPGRRRSYRELHGAGRHQPRRQALSPRRSWCGAFFAAWRRPPLTHTRVRRRRCIDHLQEDRGRGQPRGWRLRARLASPRSRRRDGAV